MKLPNWLHSTWNWIVRNKFFVGAIVAVAVLSAVVWGWEWLQWMSWLCWSWLGAVSEFQESRSTTLRNIGLLVGGGIAIWVAYRRSVIAQSNLLNERCQKGADMLGSPVLAVRLGGIYALRRLASDHPEQYHGQVMLLLSAFIRHPTKDNDDQEGAPVTSSSRKPNLKDDRLRDDVEAAIWTIGARTEADVKLWEKEKFYIDLTNANLTGARLFNANLTNVILNGANLTRAFLKDANLTGAMLALTDFSGSRGLTQAQLDQAVQPHLPLWPKLRGLKDPVTGAPLKPSL